MNDASRVRILLVEDSETDALLLTEALAEIEGFDHQVVHVPRLEDGLVRVGREPFDVVLLDLGLPDSQGVETFITFHSKVPEVAVLVLTALMDESVAVAAMHLGAQDYVTKSQLHPQLLARSVRYAIERHRSTAELIQSRQQLRKLAARLQAVREDERTHISREIHDELGQLLTGLKMDLRMIERRLSRSLTEEETAALRERAVDAQKLADHIMSSVQRISLELRPSALDHLGLADAIRDEARRFEGRTGVRFRLCLPENPRKLEQAQATALFRIFQELLTNVARHAQAHTVDVLLADENSEWVLEVRDDGVGISNVAVQLSSSLGLLSMSERAASLGGTIRVDGEPGKGTRTRVVLPCKGC